LKNVFAFFCLGSVLYIFISLVSYSSLDPSLSSVSSKSNSIENLGGPFGAYLSDALFSIAGIGAYLFLLIISFVAVKLLFFYRISDRTHKIIKVVSAILLVSSFSALSEFYYSGDYFPQSSSGGLIGSIIFSNLSSIFGVVGSLIFIVIFFLASVSLTFSFSWLSVIDALGHGAKYLISELGVSVNRLFKFLWSSIRSIDFSKFQSKAEPILEHSIEEAKPRELNLPPSSLALSQPVTNSKDDSKLAAKTEIQKNESGATSTVYKPKDKNINSEMPSTDLLDRVLDDGSSLTKEQLDEVADRLEIKLQEFGVEAKVVSVIPGPVVTRF